MFSSYLTVSVMAKNASFTQMNKNKNFETYSQTHKAKQVYIILADLSFVL